MTTFCNGCRLQFIKKTLFQEEGGDMDWLTFLSKLIWPAIVVYVLLKYREPIGDFVGTLKDWTRIVFPGGSVERENRESKITPKDFAKTHVPEFVKIQIPEDQTLSPEATKVLSTLWKHQVFYYPDDPKKGRWSFGVGFGNRLYQDYLVGIGDLIKRGLVTTSLSKDRKSVV
jgi:hypothetical protein